MYSLMTMNYTHCEDVILTLKIVLKIERKKNNKRFERHFAFASDTFQIQMVGSHHRYVKRSRLLKTYYFKKSTSRRMLAEGINKAGGRQGRRPTRQAADKAGGRQGRRQTRQAAHKAGG
jgi:hypothetical protein